MDLLQLLKSPEGKTLELKRDLSSPNGILRTIVAFANTSGGVLLIGVEDGTRHVRGISDPTDAEERLASLISDTIVPRLLPEIEILPWRDTQVLAVEIFPSPARPYYLKQAGIDSGVYVRVGSTNRRADREMIEELRRYARGEAFDEQAMPELNSEAIDFRVASELFAPVRKLARRDLESLRLVVAHQGRKVPAIGGILLFGKDREQLFPDAWIQVGRFRGLDKSQIEDHADLRSNLLHALEDAIAFVHKHIKHGAEIGAVRRTERWELPPIAVREAIINAVVHADYSQRGSPIRIAIFDDRLEVENPGILPFGLAPEDLPRGVSKLRNRVLGRVFRELGLVEQWGSGIQRIMAACRDGGFPPPTFEEIGARFRVTLWSQRAELPSLDKTDQAIIAVLATDQGRLTSEIAAAIGLTPRSTRTRLAKLVACGLVREIGSSPQDPQRRYFLTG